MELITPVGRFVQGSISLETKMDPQTNQPKLDEKGNQIKEMFMAVAFSKTDPNVSPLFNAMYQEIYKVGMQEFPTLFDAQGRCINPQFAWKIQDGDGVDANGNSVAAKPGFAGHWIVKFGSRYLPKCFHYGKYDPAQQILNPTEIIKRGYYVRVAFTVRGNGVKPGGREKPGLFVSPQLVELVAFGEEIQSGPDAQKVLGGAAPITALPAGASSAPVIATGGTLTPPPMPGAAALPPPGAAVAAPVALPPPGAAVAAPVARQGLPPPVAAPTLAPPPAAGPTYTMTAKALGNTREALHAQGWTDAVLVSEGLMVIS